MPATALACTQVWVPGQYTANGDRYVGRSEDFASRHVKIFGVREPQANTHYTSEESDFDWTSDKTSYRYTYVQDHPSDWADRYDAYAEAGINEHGVSCSATLTTNMNAEMKKVDPLTDTGIGEYNYASVILGESATAREGVELLGRLIDQYGAYSNDQITISDADESWLFCALSGHQWVAFLLPEDQVSVNPNMGNLRFKVDLDDSASCIHSKDLLNLPQEHGLLKTFDDGTPDIASTYGKPDSGQGVGQNTRYVQGRHYFGASLAEDLYTVDAEKGVVSLSNPELFFNPGRSDYTTNDVLRSLAARGEGTDVDANANPGFYAIGNNRTVESHIFQIRDGLADDIATVQWEALSRAEFSIYVPLYSALLDEASPYFSNLDCDESHQGSDQSDNVDVAMEEEPENSLPFVLMDINTLAYNNRDAVAGGTRAYLDALQNQIIEQQEAVDALMQALPEDTRDELADKAQLAVVEQTYQKCDALLDEMRAFLKGEGGETFSPSDLGEDGNLVKPITYDAAVRTAARELVAPVITAQPQGASYKQGDKAKDLTVEAQIMDGLGELSYEWFTKTEDGEATTGVKTANMPVSTDKAGKTTYFCRVSNEAGNSIDSESATFTVTKSAEKPDPDPENPGEKPDPKPENPGDKPGNKPGDNGNGGTTGSGGSGSIGGTSGSGSSTSKPGTNGDLPQTGDPASMAALLALGGSGAGIAAVGVHMMRRRNGMK